MARKLLSRPKRQEAILRGAATAFVTKGFASTSMEEVAVASGITKEIVYRNFASKEEVYRAVLEQTVHLLQTKLAWAMKDQQTGAGIRAVLTVGRTQPDGLRLLWRHAGREPKFAAYALEVRSRIVNWVMQRCAGPDTIWRRMAAEAAVVHVWDAVLTWLDIGATDQDDLFIRRCVASVDAVMTAWTATPGSASKSSG